MITFKVELYRRFQYQFQWYFDEKDNKTYTHLIKKSYSEFAYDYRDIVLDKSYSHAKDAYDVLLRDYKDGFNPPSSKNTSIFIDGNGMLSPDEKHHVEELVEENEFIKNVFSKEYKEYSEYYAKLKGVNAKSNSKHRSTRKAKSV